MAAAAVVALLTAVSREVRAQGGGARRDPSCGRGAPPLPAQRGHRRPVPSVCLLSPLPLTRRSRCRARAHAVPPPGSPSPQIPPAGSFWTLRLNNSVTLSRRLPPPPVRHACRSLRRRPAWLPAARSPAGLFTLPPPPLPRSRRPGGGHSASAHVSPGPRLALRAAGTDVPAVRRVTLSRDATQHSGSTADESLTPPESRGFVWGSERYVCKLREQGAC